MVKQRSRLLPCLLACVAVVLCVWLWAGVAHAAVVRGTDVYELPQYTLLEGDFYFVGDTMRMLGTTTGDVYAVGSAARFEGVVAEDVALVVGTADLAGKISGDARIVGGVVTVSGTVEEDLVVLAGTLVVEEEARILGDVLVYGDRFELKGDVEGVLEAHVKSAVIEGSVAHRATVRARESLAIRGDAHLDDDLVYTAPREAFISDTATVVGEQVYSEPLAGSLNITSSIVVIVLEIVMAIVGSVLLAWFFPRWTTELLTRVFRERGPWLALPGFIFLFAIPVLAVLAAASFIGFLPGLLALLGYLFILALSFPVAGIVLGMACAVALKRTDGMQPAWAAVGAALGVLLGLVPYIGWLLQFLLVVLAFGAILTHAYDVFWLRRRAAGDVIAETHGDATTQQNEATTPDA